MCYGTKDCERCGGKGELVDAFDKPVECWECEGEGWVKDPDVDDVCENCDGWGEVRAYSGDCDIDVCPACKGTGQGCYGSNYGEPHECGCERCAEVLADRADAAYDEMRDAEDSLMEVEYDR